MGVLPTCAPPPSGRSSALSVEGEHPFRALQGGGCVRTRGGSPPVNLVGRRRTKGLLSWKPARCRGVAARRVLCVPDWDSPAREAGLVGGDPRAGGRLPLATPRRKKRALIVQTLGEVVGGV